jgi:hypothetical protein
MRRPLSVALASLKSGQSKVDIPVRIVGEGQAFWGNASFVTIRHGRNGDFSCIVVGELFVNL